MLTVRAYVFTIFTVPDASLQPALRQGDRILVNKWTRADFKAGDIVLFSRHGQRLGRIVAVPGDTIEAYGNEYLIPKACHEHCQCGTCRYYLLHAGPSRILVQQEDIIGKAHFLFRWKR